MLLEDDLYAQSKYDLISICNADLSDDEVNDSPFVHNNNNCKYYEPIELAQFSLNNVHKRGLKHHHFIL